MSLKEEIEKLIRAEQDKLEGREEKHKDFHQHQRNRFACLRVILEEICASVDSKYLIPTFREDSATLLIGNNRDNQWKRDAEWCIQPNYESNLSANAGESLFYEKPGFRLEEVKYYYIPEYDRFEKMHVLPDEKSLSEYLIKAIAEKVASYRHREAAVAKTEENK